MGKKLLILGAGGHGNVVREVALSLWDKNKIPLYETIGFLDDNARNAVGKISELENFKDIYDEVFCSIGNNEIRKKILDKAMSLGFHIPTLIHPTSYVSPSAMIHLGVLVEPKAIINTNAVICAGCIISVNATIDHDVIVGEYAHVNSGAICEAGSVVDAYRKIEAGEVVKKDIFRNKKLENNIATYHSDEKWVKEYRQQFGENPGFF